jgi:hypothetical protein
MTVLVLALLALPVGAQSQSPAKETRKQREALRKRLVEHFNAQQEQVDVLEDGQVRVQFVYDLSNAKSGEDFKLSRAAWQPGGIEIDSPGLSEPAALIWKGKLRGNFFVRMEYTVTQVHKRESGIICLRTQETDDVEHPTEGVGVVAVSAAGWDVNEWRMYIVKVAPKSEALSDEDNPLIVRQTVKARCGLSLKREGLTLTSVYGQSKPLSGTAEGPDPNFLRISVRAAGIRVVRFEVAGHLDRDFVDKVAPSPKLEPRPAPSSKPVAGPKAAPKGTPLWEGKEVSPDWMVNKPDRVKSEDGRLVLDGTSGSAIAICQKVTFDSDCSVEAKLKVDLVGEDMVFGFLLCSGIKYFGEGDLVVELRETGRKTFALLNRVERGKGKILKQVDVPALKPGEYCLRLQVVDSSVRFSVNGTQVFHSDAPLPPTFKLGIWGDRCHLRVKEATSEPAPPPASEPKEKAGDGKWWEGSGIDRHWSFDQPDRIKAEGGHLVLVATSGRVAATCQKRTLEPGTCVEAKLKLDLVGENVAFGLLLSCGKTFFGPGDLVVELKEDDSGPKMRVTRVEKDERVVLKQAVGPALRPGEITLRLEMEKNGFRVSANGGEPLRITIPTPVPFKFGIWGERCLLRLLDASTRTEPVPAPKPQAPKQPGVKTTLWEGNEVAPDWLANEPNRVNVDKGYLLFEASDQTASAICQKLTFDSESSIEAKFSFAQVGKQTAFGFLLSSSGTFFEDGDWVVELRQNGGQPKIVLTRVENEGRIVVKEADMPALKLGQLTLRLETRRKSVKVSLNGAELLNSEVSEIEPFKLGIWGEKCRLRLMEATGQ